MIIAFVQLKKHLFNNHSNSKTFLVNLYENTQDKKQSFNYQYASNASLLLFFSLFWFCYFQLIQTHFLSSKKDTKKCFQNTKEGNKAKQIEKLNRLYYLFIIQCPCKRSHNIGNKKLFLLQAIRPCQRLMVHELETSYNIFLVLLLRITNKRNCLVVFLCSSEKKGRVKDVLLIFVIQGWTYECCFFSLLLLLSDL